MTEPQEHHFSLPCFALFDLMNTLRYLSGILEVRFEIASSEDENFENWIWAIAITTEGRLAVSTLLTYAYYCNREHVKSKPDYQKFSDNLKQSKCKKFVMRDWKVASDKAESSEEIYNFALLK
jgi:hypothetical protein